MTHRIGISGWTYPPWRGNFYPKGLRQKDELSVAAAWFSTIEVNGTFYGLQKPGSFAVWAAQVPDGFVFSVKAPRFITHIKRLRDAEAPVANFLASDVFATFSWNPEQILISCFNVRSVWCLRQTVP